MEPERRRRIIETYRRRAPTYDSGLAFAQRWRLWPRTHGRAVSRLSLERGDVVLDVGCGTGLSFSHIERAIGEGGRLIGIDLSPDMLAKARERVDAAGWRNVTLISRRLKRRRSTWLRTPCCCTSRARYSDHARRWRTSCGR